MGVGILVAIMGPPKSKENYQNVLLNVIFIQTVQGGQCVEHKLYVNNCEIVSLHENTAKLRKYKANKMK